MSAGVASQEGQERRQAGHEIRQRIRDRESQSQRRPLRVEVAGQRRVPRAVSRGLRRTGACQRGAHQQAAPPGEGVTGHNWLPEEAKRRQRGEGLCLGFFLMTQRGNNKFRKTQFLRQKPSCKQSNNTVSTSEVEWRASFHAFQRRREEVAGQPQSWLLPVTRHSDIGASGYESARPTISAGKQRVSNIIIHNNHF